MNTSPLAWQSDDYGTLLLHPQPENPHVYLYLQPRRPYCDRGHWEWGNLGIVYDRREAPSYYFMRQEVLRAEVEAWLGRLTGLRYEGPRFRDLPDEGRRPFQQAHGRDQGWAWGPSDSPHALEARAEDPATGTPVVLTLTEYEGRQGPVWTLTQTGVPNLDDADRFPRTYLSLEHAQQEVEDFLAWRLLKVACEFPDRFEGVVHPLPAELSSRLAQWDPRALDEALKPRSRRPK